ncbi:MAG TPA: hypothetical protein VLS93_05565 [Anaeromyxobacteraceae bacterium]|nr:hypothetical protein [Anaeromyxobacteraceae bacterium]
MADRDPDLEREEIRLPDGRRLVYYRFPEKPDADRAPDAPGSRGEPAPGGPPHGKER